MSTKFKSGATKAKLRSDIKYIRELCRQAETEIKDGNWKIAESIFQEIGAMGSTDELFCEENFQAIEDAYRYAYDNADVK